MYYIGIVIIGFLIVLFALLFGPIPLAKIFTVVK